LFVFFASFLIFIRFGLSKQSPKQKSPALASDGKLSKSSKKSKDSKDKSKSQKKKKEKKRNYFSIIIIIEMNQHTSFIDQRYRYNCFVCCSGDKSPDPPQLPKTSFG
jgi:hypothetical protein